MDRDIPPVMVTEDFWQNEPQAVALVYVAGFDIETVEFSTYMHEAVQSVLLQQGLQRSPSNFGQNESQSVALA